MFSSLAPLGFVYAFVYRNTCFPLAVGLAGTGVFLVLLCGLVLRFFSSGLEQRELRISSIKLADQQVLAFVVAYLLPLVSQDPKQVDIAVVAVVFAVLFAAIYRSNAFHFNPLLGLIFRYHFYEAETKNGFSYVVVSRRKITDTNAPIEGKRISDYMFLDVKG